VALISAFCALLGDRRCSWVSFESNTTRESTRASTSIMASDQLSDMLKNIIQYEEQGRTSDSQRMDVDRPDELSNSEAHLDDLISHYQARVQQRRKELEHVRSLDFKGRYTNLPQTGSRQHRFF
jgi:hypothetical protein